MSKLLPLLLGVSLMANAAFSQSSPAISSWLRNTTGIKGRHYVAGNSTPINDNYPANVQSVKYSANWVYVTCSGIPSYIIGPYLDGNPSQGTNQNNIYKIPLNPVKNTGTPSPTTGGNIGAFINGVALFDYRDGVSYNFNTGSNQGGPLGGMGNGVWNRDAVVAERNGFDCAKGHPAMGNYHHHQNPSAFKFDLNVISNVCNLYTSDGLYVIDSTVHSPLLGFAYDGFPIYGAYSYKNVDGTGGIARMKSSYSLRNITVRTHYADDSDVTDGPPVNATFPLGLYREDYQYNPTSMATPDYLDEHNGRFCVTPEYPNGTYCYFATVNQNWNSTYPYVVGPTFYGIRNVTRVTSITEPTTTYNGPPLAATASITQVACSGDHTGAITLTPTGGNPPYTFNWGNGITTQNRTGLAAGTYMVTITDVTAQTAVQTFIVIQPQNPLSASAAVVHAQCFGNANGEISLNTGGGTPDYSYSWSDGATNPNRSGLPAGFYMVTITDAHQCTAILSEAIQQPPEALTITTAAESVKCFGAASGIIQLTPAGGTSGYSFLWNDGNTTSARQALNAGAYSVTVTDEHQCTASATAIITQPSAPLAASTVITPIACYAQETGAIQLAATGGTSGYSVLWSDGNTDFERFNLPGGLYAATLTDANGCTSSIAETVVQASELITTTTTQSAVCGENNGSIALIIDGGTAPYSFLWNNNETTKNIADLGSGAYSATVTDAHGCTAQATAALNNLNGPSVVTTITPVNCHGAQDGSIQLNIIGGTAPFTFEWGDGFTEQNRVNLSSGVYVATITDANHCAAIVAETITQPDAINLTVSTSPDACGQSNGAIALSANGGTSPYTYHWSNDSDTPGINGLAAGAYAVTVTDTNGCTATRTTDIPAIDGPTATTLATNVACTGAATGSIQLEISNGTAPFNYLWSNGFTGQNQVNLPAGNYTVTIIDANGCSVIRTQAVTEPALPLTLSAIVTPVACYGEATGTIVPNISGGTGTPNVSWSGNQASSSLSALYAGVYTVLVIDSNGCTASVESTIEQPSAPLEVLVTAVNDTGTHDGSISAKGAGGNGPVYAYNWSNGLSGSQLSNLSPGTYTVTVTDENGCTATASATIDLTISTENVLQEMGLKLFPNPASELILIQSQTILHNSLYLKLSSANGQVLQEKEFPQGSTLCFFETDTLYDGMYFLTVSDGNALRTFKVQIAR